MVSQVIFKIDKKLKDKAMVKAKHVGIPFATVLKFATKAFIDGDLTVGLVGSAQFNATTQREIKGALKDITRAKNLSPRISSAKEAAKFLKV